MFLTVAKRTLATCAIAVAASSLAACGGGASHPAYVRFGPREVGALDGDYDHDNSTGSHRDPDDTPYLTFGSPAAAADRVAIESLVRRYYAAAAAGDGVAACRMIYSLEAEMIAERASQASPRSGAHAQTCAEVAAKTFARHHSELVAKRAELRFLSLRVAGEFAIVLLGFGAGHESYLQLHHEVVWKTTELEDMPLP